MIGATRFPMRVKRVQPLEIETSCDVCGRTMLKGERAEPYLLPSRERRFVCDLCAARAQQEGWIRESAAPAMPARPPRPRERRGLLRRRARRGRFERTEAAELEVESELPADAIVEPPAPEVEPPTVAVPSAVPRDPRHVTAIPTNAQLKVERAMEVFNASEHRRTIAGIAKTLGSPRVSACTSSAHAAEVVLTVAWDLSWYQFAVDLSDGNAPVRLNARGEELGELEPKAREWNAHARDDGSIAPGPEDDVEDDVNGERQSPRL